MPTSRSTRRKKEKEVAARGLIASLQDAGKQLPHLSELAEAFITIAGGPMAMAQLLLDEFHKASRGGVVRQRILDMVMRLWGKCTEKSDRVRRPEHMTTEDLDSEIQSLIEQYSHAESEETQGEAEDKPGDSPGSFPENTCGAGI